MENILLIFLSPIRINNGFANKTKYENLDGEETETTNESAVRYLLQNYLKNPGDLSKIFVFASQTVRENIAELKEPITHLQYFKNRIAKFAPNGENLITDETIYSYDEESTDTQNLKTVAEMAERIQKFAEEVKKNSGKEVCLHVDLTGGMRHINMMMLDVTRLLEYSGIKIGHLIYSNYNPKKRLGKVEEVKNIYDLFQLISGVEEFVNYGSVEVLNDYYNRHKDKIKLSADLKKLIVAMKNFAEEIKLCHYGQFRKSVQELHDAINDFSADPENLHDIFMARLIGRVREDYKLLLETRGIDDLKIIRWCIAKGYLQQALTLYTERVPEYLGEKNFVEVPLSEISDLEKVRKNDKRSFYFYLLNIYDGDEKDVEEKNKSLDKKLDEISKDYGKFLKEDALNAINKKRFTFDKWIKQVRSLSSDSFIKFSDEATLRKQLELLVELKKDSFVLLNLSNEELDPIRAIFEKRRSELGGIIEPAKRYEKILEYIKRIKWQDLSKYFPVFKRTISKPILRLKVMIDKRIFNTVISEEKFFSIMKKYFILKDERNNSNHAHDWGKLFKTAAELENFMINALDEIEDAQKTLSK